MAIKKFYKYPLFILIAIFLAWASISIYFMIYEKAEGPKVIDYAKPFIRDKCKSIHPGDNCRNFEYNPVYFPDINHGIWIIYANELDDNDQTTISIKGSSKQGFFVDE